MRDDEHRGNRNNEVGSGFSRISMKEEGNNMWMVLLPFCLAAIGCGDGATSLPSTVLPQTNDVRLLSNFPFTVSPDNKWMLFYQQVPVEELMSVHDDARLRVLDLGTGNLYRFEMPDRTGPIESSWVSTARWTADGDYYVGAKFAIVIGEDPKPDIVMNIHHERDAIQIGDRVIPHKDIAQCSDCYKGTTDSKAIQAVIGAEAMTHISNYEQIVSRDRGKVYYQKGRQSNTVHIHERDRDTGEDRRLASHSGRCASAMYLRLSPNGRYLAYQIGTGCQWVNPSRLYIVDVQEKTLWRVGADVFQDVFYKMHWTSDSKRLYYAGRDSNRVNYIAYVDLPATKPEDDDGDAIEEVSTEPASKDRMTVDTFTALRSPVSHGLDNAAHTFRFAR